MQGKGIRGSEVAQSKMMQPVSHQQATTHPGPKQSAHPIRHAFMSTYNICRCLQLTPMAKLFSRSQSAVCGHSPLDSIHLLVPMSCFWSQFSFQALHRYAALDYICKSMAGDCSELPSPHAQTQAGPRPVSDSPMGSAAGYARVNTRSSPRSPRVTRTPPSRNATSNDEERALAGGRNGSGSCGSVICGSRPRTPPTPPGAHSRTGPG